MDIKELIEKAFAVGHTIVYGNTENHYKPEFERWWNDKNTQEQVKNCSIPVVSQQRELLEAFITWYNSKPKGKKGELIYVNDIIQFLKH